jgi:hypothetical protein
MVTILNMLLHVYASFLFLMWKHYIYLSVISFDTLGVSIFYQNFHFRTYPSYWFSLCMAKKSLGTVLTEYS